jgi:hypothetical protein
MRQTICQLFADRTTNRNCPMVGDQQTIDPTQVVNGKGTSAANVIPPTRHMTNNEGCHPLSAADTCVLSTAFCDRLLPVSCTSHCRSAVTNSLSVLRFVPVSDTLQYSLVGRLLLVWKSFLAQESVSQALTLWRPYVNVMSFCSRKEFPAIVMH